MLRPLYTAQIFSISLPYIVKLARTQVQDDRLGLLQEALLGCNVPATTSTTQLATKWMPPCLYNTLGTSRLWK